MVNESQINISVALDKDKVPQQITWSASESTAEKPQQAKAMLLSFWDGADKSALKVDLWTKDMMTDDMADFYYQTLMSMADTFHRATRNASLMKEMKNFANNFHKKFTEMEQSKNG